MNTPPPGQWPNRVLGAALMLFFAALVIYAATRLVVKAAPVLMTIAIAGLVAWIVWHEIRRRRSGW